MYAYRFEAADSGNPATLEEFRSCKDFLENPRVVKLVPIDEMVILYQRRYWGEPVSEEAKAVTVCQIYWYRIFAELGI